MKIKHLVLAVMMSFLSAGCYGEIIGTVVDAETGKPIEGAVILVQWTVTKGFGLTYHKRYKVIETVTDKDGEFIVSGVLNPFVDRPEVVIYKKGYVTWRNDTIFPDYEKRNDFKWRDNYVFRLERFKKSYSHSKHISFTHTALSLNASSKLYQAYSWENSLASKEEKLYRKKLQLFKHDTSDSDKIHKQIWDEIIQELYFQQKGEPK